MMEHKGFIGKVEFDDVAGVFHGEVINIRDVVTFQGKSVAELRKAFQNSLDDYLDFCEERGEEPDKPFSGQFVTRISPELHRQVSTASARAGKSLNAWVTEQLQTAVWNVDAGSRSAGKKQISKVAKKRTNTKRKRAKRKARSTRRNS